MSKYIHLLLFLSFSIICMGQNAEEYLEMARAKEEAKDYNYALTLIEKSIEADDKDIWSRLLKADILLGLNRVREAKGELDIAIQIDPEHSEPYNRLGDLFLSANMLDQSIVNYDKAIEYAKNDTMTFSYHVNRATAKGVLRDFDGAVEDFEKAYSIDDTNLAVLNNLAAIYQEIGQENKGNAMFKKTISLYPEFIGPYVNLGLTYSEMDSLELSEYYFSEALKLDPEEPLLLNNFGYLYYKKKEYEKALAYINKSINLYPNNSYAYRNRALIYIDLELMKEACRDLDIAQQYDFKTRYGDEVEKLVEKHCKDD